jgi:dipeptidyl aminopeptidase/acylaminoacyl peptidase
VWTSHGGGGRARSRARRKGERIHRRVRQYRAGIDARPDAPATRIAETNERMSSPVATRDGKSVIFRSDRGGDENWSFFKVDLDGANLIELTPGERLRRDFAALPEGKPDTLFYTARKARIRAHRHSGSRFRAADNRRRSTKSRVRFARPRLERWQVGSLDAHQGAYRFDGTARRRGERYEHARRSRRIHGGRNEGHSLDRRENRVALYARAARFLETHLAAK